MGWKIVHDNDPVVAAAQGVSGQWRPSVTPIAGLTRKLFEEASEWAEDAAPGDLYDLRDVLNELITRIDPAGHAARLHEKKVATRGTFSRCIEWSPVPAESAHLDLT